MICCENVVDVKFLKNEKLNYIKKKKKKKHFDSNLPTLPIFDPKTQDVFVPMMIIILRIFCCISLY